MASTIFEKMKKSLSSLQRYKREEGKREDAL
jgi:hypothetical protein